MPAGQVSPHFYFSLGAPSLRGNCVVLFWIPKWRLGFAPLTTIPVSRCSGTSVRAPPWLLLSARQPQRLHVQLIRPTIVCGKGLGASIISSHHADVSDLAGFCRFIRCTESSCTTRQRPHCLCHQTPSAVFTPKQTCLESAIMGHFRAN